MCRSKNVRYHEKLFISVVESACKLYFDLEYKIADNPECQGNEMVEIIIQVKKIKLLVYCQFYSVKTIS